MKTIGLISLVLSILAVGCQPATNQEKIRLTDSLSNGKIETDWTKFDVGEFGDKDDQPKELEKFEMTFAHSDKEQNVNQTLGVTWISSDSIEFRLITDDDLCGTDYWGNAKNNYAEIGVETDEDESGESYLASEYVNDEETHSIRIRISLNKDRAKIIFEDRSGEETDCFPASNLVLARKNAR